MLYHFFKRFFDIICSLIGIIGTLLLWIIAALGILISDWGPVFYTANRIGRGNKPFKMYKFRSMMVSRTAKESSEASLRPEEDRIFPFGHFIRKVKIDELPQLLNILNGTMSIIGPRPVAQDQFDMFRYRPGVNRSNEEDSIIRRIDIASTVPVGLSGPAALYDFIYGDQITDSDEYKKLVYPTRRELEAVYVNKASFLYDSKMIVYTLICIIYAVLGKTPVWILKEFLDDAKLSNPELDVMPKLNM